MPTCLKSAVLSPLLKKPDAHFLQFKNFKPISNLKALSKIIEKNVALQLNNYLMNNNLHENFQSACRVHHSNETVMVKVQDDILHATDSNKAVVLLMLDLSAAFDTVSHEILLDRLSQHKWYYRVCTRMVHIIITCHLVRNTFKLNVQDLLYMNLTAVYCRGPSIGLCYTFVCLVHFTSG